jgi:hypothetical protein
MNYLRCLVFFMLFALPFAGIVALNASAEESSALVNPLDKCNVVWDSPSKDHNGSMPIGNGDIGMNVWVEAEWRPAASHQQDRRLERKLPVAQIGACAGNLFPQPFQ